MTALREIYSGVVWGILWGLVLAILLIWLSSCAPALIGYGAMEAVVGTIQILRDDAKTPPHP